MKDAIVSRYSVNRCIKDIRELQVKIESIPLVPVNFSEMSIEDISEHSRLWELYEIKERLLYSAIITALPEEVYKEFSRVKEIIMNRQVRGKETKNVSQ